MGASVPAATAILLVAALVSFGVYHAAEDAAQDMVLDAQDAKFTRQQEQLDTMLKISLVYSVYDEHNVFQYSNVTVENSGTRVINISSLHLLLNGVPTEFTHTILDSSQSELWMPGELLVLEIENELKLEESNRIKVISGNGASDLLVYGGV